MGERGGGGGRGGGLKNGYPELSSASPPTMATIALSIHCFFFFGGGGRGVGGGGGAPCWLRAWSRTFSGG